MIEFFSGDLLQTQAQYVAQGVATGSQEGLGTGLALKISMKWPDAQRQFKKHTNSSRFAGGDVFVVGPTDSRPGVIYIATQPDMYHATLPFLNKGLRNLVRACSKLGILSVAIPKIGAGLGKLNWEYEVKPLLIKSFADTSTHFLIYEDFRREFESEGQA